MNDPIRNLISTREPIRLKPRGNHTTVYGRDAEQARTALLTIYRVQIRPAAAALGGAGGISELCFFLPPHRCLRLALKALFAVALTVSTCAERKPVQNLHTLPRTAFTRGAERRAVTVTLPAPPWPVGVRIFKRQFTREGVLV
jgi:hypothetical protein